MVELSGLMAEAGQLRDRGHGRLITYSRKVFIPLTHLCRDVCHYCTFAERPRAGQPAYLSPDQVLAIARAGAAAPAGDLSKHPGVVKSPMVGTAYLAPEPGKPNFVSVGDKIAVGQTLLIIEAMKTFNPIKASKAGTVTQILVDNGRPVEFGEPLMIVE